MSQPNSTNDGGSHFPPVMGFPSIMVDAPPTAGAGGYKPNTLNSSCMNYSTNTNSITDGQSVSYSPDFTQASSLYGNASVVQVGSPGCFDGGVFTHVPPPPTDMLWCTMDSDQLAASGARRLDSSLSFSASASYVPVPAQQWSYVPSPSSAPEGTQATASCVYANVSPNGRLVHVIDQAGNAVWCIQSDHGSTTGAPLPPPPPPPLSSVALMSSLQTSMVESSPSSQAAPASSTGGTTTAAPFKVSPLAWALQVPPSIASPDAQPGGGSSSPPAEGSTDEYEYEPYNSNTLANRRVGSLDRVRCKVHGKERSAQNMVMVRNKITNEVHWRCKRSSQCKARAVDSDDTPLSSKESTLRSNAAEALLSPTSDNGPSVIVNALPTPTGGPWARQPPAPPQYTLVSPNNGALPLDGSFQSMSQPAKTYTSECGAPTAHMVALPSTFTPGQPYASSAAYFPVYAQESAQQVPIPPPPQQQQQPPKQGRIVTVNGVPYRIMHVDASPGYIP